MADHFKLRAEVIGAFFALGLLDEKAIVRWADDVVARESHPDPAILSISVDALGARVFAPDLVRALARVDGHASRSEVTHAALGVVARRLARAPAFAERAETAVFRLVSGTDTVTTPAGLELGLSDRERAAFFDDTYRTLSSTARSDWHVVLGAFLAKYAPFAIDVPLD